MTKKLGAWKAYKVFIILTNQNLQSTAMLYWKPTSQAVIHLYPVLVALIKGVEI
jgi:hypothetical protein